MQDHLGRLSYEPFSQTFVFDSEQDHQGDPMPTRNHHRAILALVLVLTIPTVLTAEESSEHLHAKLAGGLDQLHQWGLDSELVARNSLSSPH